MPAFHRRGHQLDGPAGFGLHNRKEKRHAAYGLTEKNAAYGWIMDAYLVSGIQDMGSTTEDNISETLALILFQSTSGFPGIYPR
jgi:hypothetical protein